ncbi:MAG: glycosyltransferase family 9 protein [Acidobacteriaceae bacterium]
MKNDLIVKLGAIGDVAMAIPAVKLLNDQGSKIDWVCGHTIYPLLLCYSWLTPIPVDDAAIFHGTVSAKVINIQQLWRVLLNKQYDLCATLYYDKRYKILSLPARSEKKIMLSKRSREHALIAGRFYPDEYARILLEIPDNCRNRNLSPVRPDILPASPFPERMSAYRIALVPAGASNMLHQQILRRWPIENYASIAKSLLDRGYEVMLLGGPDDTWVRPYFEGMKVTDCIGNLSLPQVIVACDNCDAVISHDTGPLHLAGMSHAPLIGLFGPTDPGNFLPRREYVVGIWGGNGFACRPCYDGRDFAPCQHNGCMYQITPELVLRELDILLERKAQGLPSPPRITSPYFQ